MSSDKAPKPTVEVTPARPKVSKRSSEQKWGKDVIDLGFTILPSLIFRAQARLGLNATQLALLLHLADYWWHEERYPYPSKAALAERLSLSPRQVQRYLTELEDAKLIKRVERYGGHKGRLTNQYDLSGLVNRLKSLEPEFRDVEERRAQVARPGGLKRRA